MMTDPLNIMEGIKMLKQQFVERSRKALLDRDQFTRTVMGNILSEFERDEKSGNFTGWTPDGEEAVVRRYVKSLEKSITVMGQTPLSAQYGAEIELLTGYLPKFLSVDETKQLVQSIAESAKSLGQFIGTVMKSGLGKFDPTVVRAIGIERGVK